MSEPMSSGEIEDVLSSIRRLVSEDLRSAARPAFPAAAEAAPVPAPPPRLLLTPALRVVPPVAEPEPAVAEAFAEPEPEPEPQVAEPPPVEEPAPLRLEVIRGQPEPADPVEAWAGEPEHEPEPAPALDPRVASIGAGMARAPAAWEAEAGDPPLTRLSWIEVAESRDEEEAARTMPFVHRAPAAPEPVRPEEPALIATTDEVLDEAVLREIVREVLRDELQGHLGERITRNIRKLVRAEVHRALTLRDYE